MSSRRTYRGHLPNIVGHVLPNPKKNLQDKISSKRIFTGPSPKEIERNNLLTSIKEDKKYACITKFHNKPTSGPSDYFAAKLLEEKQEQKRKVMLKKREALKALINEEHERIALELVKLHTKTSKMNMEEHRRILKEFEEKTEEKRKIFVQEKLEQLHRESSQEARLAEVKKHACVVAQDQLRQMEEKKLIRQREKELEDCLNAMALENSYFRSEDKNVIVKKKIAYEKDTMALIAGAKAKEEETSTQKQQELESRVLMEVKQREVKNYRQKISGLKKEQLNALFGGQREEERSVKAAEQSDDQLMSKTFSNLANEEDTKESQTNTSDKARLIWEYDLHRMGIEEMKQFMEEKKQKLQEDQEREIRKVKDREEKILKEIEALKEKNKKDNFEILNMQNKEKRDALLQCALFRNHEAEQCRQCHLYNQSLEEEIAKQDRKARCQYKSDVNQQRKYNKAKKEETARWARDNPSSASQLDDSAPPRKVPDPFFHTNRHPFAMLRK